MGRKQIYEGILKHRFCPNLGFFDLKTDKGWFSDFNFGLGRRDHLIRITIEDFGYAFTVKNKGRCKRRGEEALK